ncbi:hypothetical protein [Sphingomonas immobilis]|uniref:Uncharacterized protein n=1 Tax=Sphingomonas immobilis TaxID=3063997 RepID=A0ABT8ZYC9_9SPHN|nr:hypothetical protein [Sphingomonas sp. CA1-15]MDO7841776.1 hypothetical protein [Sphingomonas sp. CA1-15]
MAARTSPTTRGSTGDDPAFTRALVLARLPLYMWTKPDGHSLAVLTAARAIV